MEKQYDNSNSGALFKNDKGDNPKRPDYRGELNVEGDEFVLSAWLKTSKKGEKFMSLKIQRKESDRAVTAKPSQVSQPADFDDEVPF